MSCLSSTSNSSFFPHTFQSNDIIFQLCSSTKKIRLNRGLILKNRPLPKVINALVDDNFHLTAIDGQSQS